MSLVRLSKYLVCTSTVDSSICERVKDGGGGGEGRAGKKKRDSGCSGRRRWREDGVNYVPGMMEIVHTLILLFTSDAFLCHKLFEIHSFVYHMLVSGRGAPPCTSPQQSSTQLRTTDSVKAFVAFVIYDVSGMILMQVLVLKGMQYIVPSKPITPPSNLSLVPIISSPQLITST